MGSARVMVGGTGPNAVPSSNRQVVMTPIFTSDSSSNLTRQRRKLDKKICLLCKNLSFADVLSRNVVFYYGTESVACRPMQNISIQAYTRCKQMI